MSLRLPVSLHAPFLPVARTPSTVRRYDPLPARYPGRISISVPETQVGAGFSAASIACRA